MQLIAPALAGVAALATQTSSCESSTEQGGLHGTDRSVVGPANQVFALVSYNLLRFLKPNKKALPSFKDV
jgi:hypothetical protein